MPVTLELYHGTDQSYERLRPSRSGFFGEGIYLTPDKELAWEYADGAAIHSDTPHVLTVTVELSNPFFFHAPDAITEASNETLVRMLFSDRPSALRKALRGMESRSGLTTEISIELRARGHDALAIIFSDGETEYLVFDPAAITSMQAEAAAEWTDPLAEAQSPTGASP